MSYKSRPLDYNNLCPCGCNGHPRKGKTWVHGHYQKIRPSQLGKPLSEERRRKISNSLLGKKIPREIVDKIRKINTGKKRSEETKRKMKIKFNSSEYIEKQKIVQNTSKNIEKRREQAYKRLADSNSKFGWPIDESYPEKYFREFLESMGAIKGVDFFQEYQVGRYRLDFAYIDNIFGKRDIEIDGSQHYETQEDIEHDKKRDDYLQKQGWTIFRIPVKDLKKFIDSLKIDSKG